MTTSAGAPVVPRGPASLPELRAADQGVAQSLESVLSDNTRRTYDAQWLIFAGWCDEVGLVSLPAEPLTVARYLAARANAGAPIAPLRLATSAISKAHERAKLESPCPGSGRARLSDRWVLTVYLQSGIDCAIHRLLGTLVVPIGSQLSLEPTQLAPSAARPWV